MAKNCDASPPLFPRTFISQSYGLPTCRSCALLALTAAKHPYNKLLCCWSPGGKGFNITGYLLDHVKPMGEIGGVEGGENRVKRGESG